MDYSNEEGVRSMREISKLRKDELMLKKIENILKNPIDFQNLRKLADNLDELKQLFFFILKIFFISVNRLI